MILGLPKPLNLSLPLHATADHTLTTEELKALWNSVRSRPFPVGEDRTGQPVAGKVASGACAVLSISPGFQPGTRSRFATEQQLRGMDSFLPTSPRQASRTMQRWRDLDPLR